jgi:hypothetical protein
LPARFSRNRRQHSEEEFSGSMILRKGRPYDPAWDAWQPRRRWPGVVASAIVVSGFLGAVAFHYTSKPTTAPSVIPPSSLGQMRMPYFPPVSPTSQDLQQVSGKKSASGVQFTTTGKLMIWYFQCRCVANFGIIVHNSTGAVLDVPVNNVGHTVLAVPASYEKLKLSVSVIADGEWTVSLIDPSHLANQSIPFEFFSAGQSVLGPFTGPNIEASMGFLAGIGHHFTMSISDGSSATPKLIVFESQTFTRTLVQTKLPPRFFLIINGDGFWQVKVKK